MLDVKYQAVERSHPFEVACGMDLEGGVAKRRTGSKRPGMYLEARSAGAAVRGTGIPAPGNQRDPVPNPRRFPFLPTTRVSFPRPGAFISLEIGTSGIEFGVLFMSLGRLPRKGLCIVILFGYYTDSVKNQTVKESNQFTIGEMTCAPVAQTQKSEATFTPALLTKL